MLGAAASAVVTPGEYITTPEAHGWSSGNTTTQDTAGFNAAIANAAANAGSSSTGRGERTPRRTTPTSRS